MIDEELLSYIAANAAAPLYYRATLRRPAQTRKTLPRDVILSRLARHFAEEVIQPRIDEAMTSRCLGEPFTQNFTQNYIEDRVELLVMTREEFRAVVRSTVERYLMARSQPVIMANNPIDQL